MIVSLLAAFVACETKIDNGPDYVPRIPVIPDSVASTFSEDFFFGYASSAAQVEGAVGLDGKSPSIWDVFSNTKGKVADGTNTNTTVDEYFNYQNTIDLLKLSGANSYRLSIAWTRLVPGGFRGSPVNMKAVEHYRKVFDALISNGITPFVTLYHWDMPQALDDKYKSLLNTEEWTADFLYYADTAFQHFGDQVKFWATYNEPGTFCLGSYGAGIQPPNRCLDIRKCKFSLGPLDLLRCGHTVMTSHARVVELYRTKYQPTQKGKIGMVNVIEWSEPISQDPRDVAAAQLRLDFSFGWFVDPLFTGNYPETMRKRFGFLMPKLSGEDQQLLKGSFDFFGLNHYTTSYVARPGFKRKDTNDGMGSNFFTPFVSTHYDINGTLIGEQGSTYWLFKAPWGLKKSLQYVYEKYGLTEVYITENGYSVKNEHTAPLESKLRDASRVHYYEHYLNAIQEAIKETNIKIKGYFAWTLIDNFEWQEGFTTPFGSTIYQNQEDPKRRYLKDSFFYLKEYMKKAMSQ
jgi:beta-glucosidase